MRHFSLLYILFVGLISLTGCGDLSYTQGSLLLRNESGQTLYVESTIVSRLTSEKLSFLLEEGKENAKVIALTPRYEDMSAFDLPISHYVNNEDAKVSIFTIDDNGDKLLAHIWYYSDRNKEGRELFNEDCLYKDLNGGVDGGCFPSFTFRILPEDLESSN